MDPTDRPDALQRLLDQLARTEERGPLHRLVLNGCRVLRHLADNSVANRGEAGEWAVVHWRPSDHGLIEAALARETGADRRATIDLSAAYFFGFRVRAIAKGDIDPEDR